MTEPLTHTELAELRALLAAYEAWEAGHPGSWHYPKNDKLAGALRTASAQLCAAAETVLVASEAATHYDFDADDALDGVIHCLGHERRDLRAKRDQLAELAERRRRALVGPRSLRATPVRCSCQVCNCVWLSDESEVHDAGCLARPGAADEGMFAK